MTLQPDVTDHDHVRGSASAPVTLVEFGDYECPYCGEAEPVIAAVRERFGDDLRFVFRNFPLTEMHPHAMAAALVAEAAEPNLFWQFHDLLYRNQGALDDASLFAYARSLSIDEGRVRRALDGATRARVVADIASGERSGVEGTPSFFIDGRRYQGSTELGPLSAALARALDHAGAAADRH